MFELVALEPTTGGPRPGFAQTQRHRDYTEETLCMFFSVFPLRLCASVVDFRLSSSAADV
jgi:hypothetical protein